MRDIDLVQYLNSKGLAFKEKGDELALKYCWYCENEDEGDFSHFYFEKTKSVFFCHKCGARGNLFRFMADRGDFPPIMKAKARAFKRPLEQPSILADTKEFYEEYFDKRGIHPSVLTTYKVGCLHKSDGDYIVYQYYNNKGLLINRKYRHFSDKSKMWTEKDAEPGYYGAQFLNMDVKSLFVCEGEDDCHALVQMGLDNVVSVPLGATNYSPSMHETNELFETIYLLFDNDPTGQAGAKQFAEKAGLAKCKNVLLPFKDARECLLEKMDFESLEKELGKAKPYTSDEIVKANELKDLIISKLTHPEDFVGTPIEISAFNRIMGGIRLEEMDIVTGHTGRGKSTFVYNEAWWALRAGFKCLIMSFELPLDKVINKFIMIESGEILYVFDEKANKYIPVKTTEWTEEKLDILSELPLYFLNTKISGRKGYFDIHRMQSLIEYAIRFYGVNFIVIDHLHYFLKLSDSPNPVNVIDEAVRQIKQWTIQYGIHIVLVAHPHKTADKDGKLVELGLNSAKGASSIAQEADNFFIVSRPVEKDGETRLTAQVRIEKNRALGKTGKIVFDVAENLNKYIEGKSDIGKGF